MTPEDESNIDKNVKSSFEMALQENTCDQLELPCELQLPESGVDMAFDALMDLEKNSDLSTFMKTFIEDDTDDYQVICKFFMLYLKIEFL